MAAESKVSASAIVDEQVAEQESKPLSVEEKHYYDAALEALGKEERVSTPCPQSYTNFLKSIGEYIPWAFMSIIWIKSFPLDFNLE